MQQVIRTYDTSTMGGRLELLADLLAMPADNLALGMDNLLKEHVTFARTIAQTLAQTPSDSSEHAKLCEQLQSVSGAVEMILDAQDLLRAAKYVGDQLRPQQPEEEPAPRP